MSETGEQLRTLDEAATQLRMSRDWVRKALRDGLLNGTKIGSGMTRFRWLVAQSELDSYVKRQTHHRDDEILEIAKMNVRGLPPVPRRYGLSASGHGR